MKTFGRSRILAGVVPVLPAFARLDPRPASGEGLPLALPSPHNISGVEAGGTMWEHAWETLPSGLWSVAGPQRGYGP